MKNLSTIYKVFNTPWDILWRKIKKKFAKKSELDSIALLSTSGLSIKSGMYKISKDFFERYSVFIENTADNALNNKFKIFTNEYVDVTYGNTNDYKKINWQKDQLSGFEWDVNTKSKDIIYGIGENEKNKSLRKYIGAEIKYPWELGRQQDLVNLAIFFSISNEKEKLQICDFYVNRVNDFTENNPIGFGTQWQTSMDVAIRAVNYLISYDIFVSNGAIFSKEFQDIFSQLILNHFIYIYNNLEFNDGLRGNHYFANLMGLIIIYTYFNFEESEVKLKSEEIFNFAVDSFSNEIMYQFLEDGGNFEASIPYHFLTTEMLLMSLYFLEKVNSFNSEKIKKEDELEFDVKLRNRIVNIIEFTINFLIGGEVPNIGDNDSGVVIDLMSYENKRANLIFLLDKFEDEKKDIEFAEFNQVINKLLFKNQTYFLGNYFGISRSSTRDFDLILFAGGKGQVFKGGHSHNDKCSFELYFNSKPLIVDLGSAFYTSNWKKRNYYRSVRQHNVLDIGKEQDLFLQNEKDDLFWLYGNKTKAEIVFANNERVKTRHRSYKKEYERLIDLGIEGLKGIESLARKEEKVVSFHLHHEVEVIDLEILVLKLGDDKFEFICDCDYVVKDAWYSPEYGIEFKTKKIELRSKEKQIKWEIKIVEY